MLRTRELRAILEAEPVRVFTKEELIRMLRMARGATRTLDGLACRLRQEVAQEEGSPRRVVNVWGVGYRWMDAPARPVCAWFALCENESTQERPHPILGPVPICDRCEAKVSAL